MQNRRRALALSGLLLQFLAAAPALAQEGPALAVRNKALKSLVYVASSDCADNTTRAGSGFALNDPGRIVTAHHVVGGCSKILVTYEAVGAGEKSLRTARLVKVVASRDLALLSVDGAPNVPVLKPARPPTDKEKVYAGFGYQNGQLSGGDQRVTFSVGNSRLQDVLTADAITELRKINSPIAVDVEVLRFNVALQPGMSGGPIIDVNGDVIGIVAGGLKAGAAPASWGWPAEWIPQLLASTEDTNRAIRISGSYYTLSDLQAIGKAKESGKRITCGGLQFSYLGRRSFNDVARGADDQPRVQHIMRVSMRPLAELNSLTFDIWTHEQSGATAVTPAGYDLVKEGDVCVARSNTGPFMQVIWARPASNPMDIQNSALAFESNVMGPRAPYNFGFQLDPQLTTYQVNAYGQPIPSPQFRSNGLVFTRKGFMQPKVQYYGPATPLAHSFETLVAKGGTFLGVGTLNNDVPPLVQQCLLGQAVNCAPINQHVREWTHFILATQLSTYPAY
jgi:S1-C subfamily serine protease